MRYFFTLLILLFSSAILSANQPSSNIKKEINKISGDPVVTVFANYHLGLGDEKDNSNFSLDRAYLGYKFKYGKEWSGSVIFDIGTTKLENSKLEYIAHVKNAFIAWERNDFKLNFGMVKTQNFAFQESFWGYRYLMKSFSDEYGFGPSADLGIVANYKVNNWLKTDFSLTSGSGNKVIDSDNNNRYGFGATIEPIKQFYLRAYYDIYSGDDEIEGSINEQTISTFIGYKHSKFTIGGEYNHQINSDHKNGVDLNGLSTYTTVNVISKWQAFARYDYLNSNQEENKKAGSAIRAGVEYSPCKILKIAPNVSCWMPENGDTQTYLYLSVQFKL